MRMDILLLQANSGAIITPIFWILLLATIYFFFMRPAQKRQKEQTAFQDELQKGDEVVTASGILGKVNKLEDDIVTLQVDSKTFIRFTRNAISKEMTDQIHQKEKA